MIQLYIQQQKLFWASSRQKGPRFHVTHLAKNEKVKKRLFPKSDPRSSEATHTKCLPNAYQSIHLLLVTTSLDIIHSQIDTSHVPKRLPSYPTESFSRWQWIEVS